MAALQDLTDVTADQVFGPVDAMKLRSSLTLFALTSEERIFEAALARWFGGEKDPLTIAIAGRWSAA